ncbi:hypothetical protein [Ruficoccus sp. ZRK36]|nr:hypothetical protein [Ruficoccus sp. ZRK36]QYY36977.1 hypothetical protein K0V07_05730 [Ruficoccus sp. ZRK36]
MNKPSTDTLSSERSLLHRRPRSLPVRLLWRVALLGKALFVAAVNVGGAE